MAYAWAASKITKPKIKIIYTLGQELGLVDRMASTDNLHAMVYSLTKKEHIGDLTNNEADTVINSLKNDMRGAGRLKPVQRPVNMATEGEIRKIWALLYALKNYDHPGENISLNKRLRGFLKKYAGIDDIRFLTHEKAGKIIEGLKGLIQTEERKASR